MRRLIAPAARPNSGIFARSRRGASVALASFAGQVLASADDAHEDLATGVVSIADTVLQMGGFTGVTTPYVTGVRYTGVTVGQGESVPYASLRFVAKNQNTKGCLLRIWCEDADNASTFTTANGNISGRTKTSAYFDWDVPPWSVGQDDADTLVEMLGPLVAEVVARPGWTPGNALAFIIATSPAIVDTEWPQRRAWAFDGSAANAPRSSVNTTEGSATPSPSPAGAFSDGYDLFGLEGRNNVADGGDFDPAAPTLKAGVGTSTTPLPITGQALIDYNTVIRHMNTQSSGDSLVNFDLRMGGKNAYATARYAGTVQHAWMRAFRLTGDLRFLDALCRGYELQRTQAMIVRFDEVSSWNPDNTRMGKDGYPNEPYPWSPYRKVPWTQTTAEFNGTNTNWLDDGKLMTRTTEFVWMLWLNRNKVSPLGYNYTTLFNTWKTILEENYIHTWSGGDMLVRWRSGGSWDSLRNKWTGIRYFGNRTTPATARSEWGEYPILCTNGSHSALDGWSQSHYLGLLGLHAGLDVGNPQGAYDRAPELVSQVLTHPSGVWRDNPSTIGTGFAFRRADWYFETGTVLHSLYDTYLGHVSNQLVDYWMMGRFRALIPYSTMRKLARNLHDMMNTNGTCRGDMLQGAPSNTTPWAVSTEPGRSTHGMSVYGIGVHGIFEDDSVSTKIEDALRTAHTASGGGWSTSGPTSGNPTAPVVPSILFTKWALQTIGDVEDV